MNPNRNLPVSIMLTLCASIILIGLFLIPRLEASKKWLADISGENPVSNPPQTVPPAAPPAPPPAAPSTDPGEPPTVAIVEQTDPPAAPPVTPDPGTTIAVAPEPVPPEAIAITADPPITPNLDSAAVDNVALVSPPSLTNPPARQEANPVIVVGDPNPTPAPEEPITVEITTPPSAEPPASTTPDPPVVAEETTTGDEVVGSIFFDAESTRLTSDSLSSLEGVLEKLNATESQTVILRGHAGEFEGETTEWIAGVRARRVMAGLLGQGVAEDRLEVDPVVGSSEDSGEERARVDIILLAE